MRNVRTTVAFRSPRDYQELDAKRTATMQIWETPIKGALEIVPDVFADARGYFKETYSRRRYQDAGIHGEFVQDNVSLSRRDTLRGLHGDRRMAKLVQVVRGRAFDVIVDFRVDSSTFLMWHATELAGSEHRQLYIPEGCLHGFLALEDDTILLYKQTALYDASQEIGVAWNDPTLQIAWPLAGRHPLLSGKDARNRNVSEF